MTTPMSLAVTNDGFLDGKLQIQQPKLGYRAATDPVFLAAAICAKPGQRVLDVGCGVGTAALCLAWRAGVKVTGIEIQSDYADLANANAAVNGLDLQIATADIFNLPIGLRDQQFDHVMTNPPFFSARKQTQPSVPSKAIAHFESQSLARWIETALRRLAPGGSFTIIHQTARLADILQALTGPCGDIRILPLTARSNRPAKRVIIQARKARNGPMELLCPFVIHQGATHVADGDDFTPEACAILRDGTALAPLCSDDSTTSR